MKKFLFFFERANGDYEIIESSDIQEIAELYVQYEKEMPQDILSFGWMEDNDSLPAQILRNKANKTKVKIND